MKKLNKREELELGKYYDFVGIKSGKDERLLFRAKKIIYECPEFLIMEIKIHKLDNKEFNNEDNKSENVRLHIKNGTLQDEVNLLDDSEVFIDML